MGSGIYHEIRWNVGTVDSAVVIGCFDQFCEAIQEPTVVVLDKASIHTSEAFQEAIPQWEKQGLSIFYLPEYSPELNLIPALSRCNPRKNPLPSAGCMITG